MRGARAKCFDSFWTAQWPKWIGCAMAAHESLAAGLIGLWAAILAAWLAFSGYGLAYSGIQMQIEEDRRKVALESDNCQTRQPSQQSPKQFTPPQ